jgi:UrcA family protein
MRIHRSGAILAIAFTVSAGAVAHADTSEPSGPQEVVRWDDLDLTSTTGARVLATRIDKAARKVCAETGPLALHGDADCRREAVARAIGDLASREMAAREGQRGLLSSGSAQIPDNRDPSRP